MPVMGTDARAAVKLGQQGDDVLGWTEVTSVQSP
jgi:hypothetical protein